MGDFKIFSVSIDPSEILTKSEEEGDIQFPYRQAVSSSMFSVVICRTDIAYAAGEVSRLLNKYNESHEVSQK